MTMKTVKTPRGTDLPLLQLKGKDYLQVAHRLVWFNEEVANFSLDSQILDLGPDHAIVKTVVSIFNKEGQLVKRADGIKREDRKDFPDFLEKAQSSSAGRALAMLGYGTQFALADLDEGERIVDSPMPDVRAAKPSTPAPAKAAPTAAAVKATPAKAEPSKTEAPKTTAPVANGSAATKKVSSFRKPAKSVEGESDGWN